MHALHANAGRASTYEAIKRRPRPVSACARSKRPVTLCSAIAPHAEALANRSSNHGRSVPRPAHRIVGIVAIVGCGLACARDIRPAGTTFEGAVPWHPDLRTRRTLADDLVGPSIDTDGRGIATGCPPQELPHPSQGVAHGYTEGRVVASSHRSDPARSRPQTVTDD